MQIAVVEDDDGVGDALVEALATHGHEAVRMRRGSDLLLGHRGMDAVILDLGLPDADGLQVLRQLRAVSDVPVVILTARDDERSVVRGDFGAVRTITSSSRRGSRNCWPGSTS